MVRVSLSLATVLIGVSFACPVRAQSEDDKLGKVHFETSCNAEAQKSSTAACCISIRSGTAPRRRCSRMR